MRKGILDQLVFRAVMVVRGNPWTCALTLLGVALIYGFAEPELFTLNRWQQSSEILVAVIATGRSHTRGHQSAPSKSQRAARA